MTFFLERKVLTNPDSVMILGISITVHADQMLKADKFVLKRKQKFKRMIPAGLTGFMVDSASARVF